MKKGVFCFPFICLLIGAAGCSNVHKAGENEVYRDFLRENYRTGAVSTLTADLTGDGKQEMIVVSRNWYDEEGNALRTDSEQAMRLQEREKEQKEENRKPIRNTVIEYPDCSPYPGMEFVGNESLITIEVYMLDESGNVNLLYQDDASNVHAGWKWLYLYKEAEKSYLFRYSPWTGQGFADYQYQVFSLSEEGEESIIYEDEICCEMLSGDESWEKTWEQMSRFLEQIHIYQKASIPLVEIGNDYFDTEYGSEDGREYNYVIDYDALFF